MMPNGALGGDIHIFDDGGRGLLYQVDTGVFFQIDGLVKDILAHAGVSAQREDLIDALLDRYGLEDLVGAIEELEALGIISYPFVPRVPEVEPSDPPSAPQTFTMCLHVSHACNIRCTYCFALGGHYGSAPRMMEWPTARRAVDWMMEEGQGAEAFHIDFFGGEPLLNFSLIQRVVAYARGKAEEDQVGITFGVTTNGTLLPPEILSFLMEEDIGILVSLDGDAATHDASRRFRSGSTTYDCVVGNVRKLVEGCGQRLKLRATLTSGNLDILGTATHLAGLGASSVTVSPVSVPAGHPDAIRLEHLETLKDHMRSLSRLELCRIVEHGLDASPSFGEKIKDLLRPGRKEYGCGGGRTYFGVAADGGIYYCSAFASVPEYRMGDVLDGIDPEIRKRLEADLHVANRETCRDCWARNLCGGGCAYNAHVTRGSTHEPDPAACEQIRFTYELAMGMALDIHEQNPDLFQALCTADR